jgi:hypothetical protein
MPQAMHRALPRSRCGLAAALTLLLACSARLLAEEVPLPPLPQWSAVDAKVADGTLSVPENYKIGRANAPAAPIEEGRLVTFSARVATDYQYVPNPSFYRCWLELEFLKGSKVLASAPSPEIIGTRKEGQLLAVTAAAPKGATAVRAVVCAQNKLWSAVPNTATVTATRLLRLAPADWATLVLKVISGFSSTPGARIATMTASGGWPEGTAVLVSTSKGATAPAVLFEDGAAHITLQYAPDEFGAAEVTARVAEQTTRLTLADPAAASLELGAVTADQQPTPVLVQLERHGKMLPGRYQQSMPGIFVTPPWRIDVAPGTWRLRVRRGPDFQPFEKTLDLASGQTLRLGNIELRRQVDTHSSGWYSGDADGDVYHGERMYTDLSAQTAADIAQAMGLDWVGVGSWGSPNPKTWGEARAVTQALSRPNLLFLWTDEKPKGRDGHACFVGLERPAGDAFGWGWTRAVRPLRNYETLKLIRDSGAATFVNHPLRWWTNGGKFRTNLYATLPFDLCAAGLIDGYNVNEKPGDILVWSMLLDHGYRVAATTGADFGLDRPIGPVPGKARMYCLCPDGLTGNALAQAVRHGHTVVSLGPVLLADINGQPPGSTFSAGRKYEVRVRAWPRADEPDPLQRLELWAHGAAVATHAVAARDAAAGSAVEHTFQWEPRGDWDWVAVRAISKRGWALTSAFYAAAPDWKGPPQTVACRTSLSVAGLTDAELTHAVVEVWDAQPGLATARKLSELPLKGTTATLDAPITATLVLRTDKGKRKDIALYDAAGIPELIERILAGTEGEKPLTRWSTYEEVLNRCREAKVEFKF